MAFSQLSGLSQSASGAAATAGPSGSQAALAAAAGAAGSISNGVAECCRSSRNRQGGGTSGVARARARLHCCWVARCQCWGGVTVPLSQAAWGPARGMAGKRVSGINGRGCSDNLHRLVNVGM